MQAASDLWFYSFLAIAALIWLAAVFAYRVDGDKIACAIMATLGLLVACGALAGL